jgi:alpha-beta hydrolase superfamily lysophospholipase
MPRLAEDEAVMTDGYRLALRRWGNLEEARAVLLAVHGFNDYGNAFEALGSELAARGILTYAYDQRGFGETAGRGRWLGSDPMIGDLAQVTRLLRGRHPHLPLYLLGESMGGAVLMAAIAAGLTADGYILLAPAVWSRDSMSPLIRFTLWAGVHTLPWLELTGEGVDIRPSDNIPMLRAYGADPLVIKATRIDALWGVTNLMDRAKESAPRLRGPLLLLYGAHDDIIPPRAFCGLLDQIPGGLRDLRLVLYRDGWHMLARDLQGPRVIADIGAWLSEPGGPLPSGEETDAGSARIQAMCKGYRVAAVQRSEA